MSVEYSAPTPEHGPELAATAEQSFVETFGHLYRPEDLSAFCEQAFGPMTGIPAELHQPDLLFRVARDEGKIVGFAKVSPLTLPVIAPATGAMELRQLYVLKGWQGAGIAPALMDWAMNAMRERGASEAYLSVYSDNIRAQRFYARYGFSDVGPYTFMVGNQADEDRIWRAKL